MRLISAIGALSLLGTVLGADDYVPLHKRFTYDETNTVDDFTYLGMLSRRDACSDAFGSNARDSTCAPDFTLCCKRFLSTRSTGADPNFRHTRYANLPFMPADHGKGMVLCRRVCGHKNYTADSSY